MKFFTGCVALAALALVATAAVAQVPSTGTLRGPLVAVSDFDGPYGAPEAPPPRPHGSGAYGYDYDRSAAPALLPAAEVYAVLRDNGFSPLAIPRLSGNVYTIAVIDPRGDDGRLVIDASDGRILRFVPAYGAGFRMGPAYDGRPVEFDGPRGALPPPTVIRSGPPRPPASIPHVASRTVPVPRAAPHRGDAPVAAARPITSEPAPQQSASAQPKPAEPPAAASSTVGQANIQAKPAPTILPTQDMPPAQGFE